MDTRFTAEDAAQLREVLADFTARYSGETDVRKAMETPEGFDRRTWHLLGTQLDVLGLAIPDQYGGSGATVVELGIVAEAMGAALTCSPFLSSAVIAATALCESGDTTICGELLPQIATGGLVATLAAAEQDGQWHMETSQVTARQHDGQWLLTGTKTFVLDGMAADVLLVPASAPEGLRMFAVSADAAGLRRTALATLDLTRRQARVDLSGTPAREVAGPDRAAVAVGRALDAGAAVLTAEQVGGARHVLGATAEYARTRVQFGRPIGSFQAVKHKLADMLVEVESAVSASRQALRAVASPGSGDDDPRLVVPLAKAYCSDAYAHVTAASVQIHGGIGFTWEHPAHLYFKRAQGDRQLFGDPRHHLERLARRVAADVA
ncbi:acyl-CoA dehydrogenase family protein [Yinghuangia sp. YIM S09857]|uniref:acyl-CoA dehydrogenase family protein n=1 Tax=Yinghuangia sp. YIM S09857 TaxID=3436929 RepID=UPI003F537739